MADHYDETAAMPPMTGAPISPAASQYRTPPSPTQRVPAPEDVAAAQPVVAPSGVEGAEQNAADLQTSPLATPPTSVPFDMGIAATASSASSSATAVLPVADPDPFDERGDDAAAALGLTGGTAERSHVERRRGETPTRPPKGFKIPKAPKPPKTNPGGFSWGRTATTAERVSAPAPLAALEADNISAWFGDHQVLDRVSLTMPAGVVTSLIGPSGCGKSTFLRILNRMHELVPSASLAGEVRLDGDDIYDTQRKLIDARKSIGMVFQKPNPFPAMSIYDNVIAGLKLTGKKTDRDEKDALVESCLMKAGLWKEVKDRLRQPGGGLSGGQQQRLCIARSLAVTPRVLLMDEPCSALDPTSTRVIEDTMLELVKDVTIVIVTHNMQQAQRVSQQCAFFLASQGTPGVIVEHGDTEAMFSDPIDPRTFDYVNGRFG